MPKVLVAVDGSQAAHHATRTAIRLLRHTPNTEFTALHANDPAVLASSGPEAEPNPGVPIVYESVTQAGEAILQDAEKVFLEEGVTPQLRQDWGSPAALINRVAEEEGYGLIVLGSTGKGRIAGLFLGSVSDAVVHSAKVPVLIVPAES